MSYNSNCGCTETQQTTYVCGECQSPTPCECEVLDLSTNCVVFTGDTIQCQNVDVVVKNTILSVALKNIIDFFCQKLSEIANRFRIVNIGTGAKVYKQENLLGQKELRTITSSDTSVTITEGTNTIDITVPDYPVVPTASNAGTGAGVFKELSSNDYKFRKIRSSNSSVTVTEGTNDIDLAVVVDTIITDGSTNPITSNAVYDALATGTTEAKKEFIVIPLGDLITNLTIGATKSYFRMPFAAIINSVSASVIEAQASGSILTFDINENGVSILSTKITIDNTEKTSVTAVAQPVVSDMSLVFDSEITFNIDQVGTAGAKGAAITLNLTRV